MANPQVENGYTKISNEILDRLCGIRISGEARQVLDVIIRKTYGFNKKQDRISLSQFCLSTGLKRPTVCRAINKLISMELIIKIDNEKGEIYIFQKDFDKWKPLSKKIMTIKTTKTLSKMIMPIIKNDNASLSKMIHTKETTTKDTLTKVTEQGSVGSREVINLFKEINPSYGILFKRKNEHESASRLLEREGFTRIQGAINFLKSMRADKFCPRISTAVQLEEKWASLENYGVSLKKSSEINNNPKWKIWT